MLRPRPSRAEQEFGKDAPEKPARQADANAVNRSVLPEGMFERYAPQQSFPRKYPPRPDKPDRGGIEAGCANPRTYSQNRFG